MRITARQASDLRAGRPPDRPETDIVAGILAYLKLVPGVVAWRQNSRVFRVPGKGGRARLLRAGVKGMPDIMGWRSYPGSMLDLAFPFARILGIEVKRPGQVPRPEQWAFLQRLKQDGGIALVATCVADVAKALR